MELRIFDGLPRLHLILSYLVDTLAPLAPGGH